jgi:hypothetical protein
VYFPISGRGAHALTVVVVILDVVAFTLVEVYKHLREMYCTHIQCWRSLCLQIACLLGGMADYRALHSIR